MSESSSKKFSKPAVMENLHRDERTMPVVRQHFEGFHDYLAAGRDSLVRGRPERGRRRDKIRAAIGHALGFTTWRSLTREHGLDDARAAELMCGLVASAAED